MDHLTQFFIIIIVFKLLTLIFTFPFQVFLKLFWIIFLHPQLVVILTFLCLTCKIFIIILRINNIYISKIRII